MSLEIIGFMVIGAIVSAIGWLAIISIRANTEELEEFVYGEASTYRRKAEEERE